MEIFLFAAHEALHPKRFWTMQAIAMSALANACFAANFRLSAKHLLVLCGLAILSALTLVLFNQTHPKVTLLHLFGIALPVFTFLTLVLPFGLLILSAAEKLLQRSVLPLSVLGTFLLIGATLNIGLLSSISVAYGRSDDYPTTLQAIAYFAGHIFSKFFILVLPALIIGALAHVLSKKLSSVVFWSTWLVLAALAVWQNYVLLDGIIFSLKFLYF